MPVTPLRELRELGPIFRAKYGGPVRKLCLRLETRCPHRGRSLDPCLEGCLFCAEDTRPVPSLEEQLASGLARGRGLLIAYLQSNTATSGIEADALARALARLRAEPRVAAIAIGTRPDALPRLILEVLAEDARRGELWVELGLQSADDAVLELCRRGHDVACFAAAVGALHACAIRVCAHVILGLPTPVREPGGRHEPEAEAGAIATARLLARLGVEAVKIHNAHVLSGTGLHALHAAGRYEPPTLERYLELLSALLAHLPASVELHRLVGEARPPLLVAPAFTGEKARTLAFLRAELARRGVRQGSAL